MSRLGLVISPGDATFTSFELMRARFLRQLRQDEFGPTNADCSAALRQLLSSFDRISQRLRALSPRNRELFSGVLATVAAGASERISFQSVIQQIGIAASDLARVVTKIDKSVRRRQFRRCRRRLPRASWQLDGPVAVRTVRTDVRLGRGVRGWVRRDRAMKKALAEDQSAREILKSDGDPAQVLARLRSHGGEAGPAVSWDSSTVC